MVVLIVLFFLLAPTAQAQTFPTKAQTKELNTLSAEQDYHAFMYNAATTANVRAMNQCSMYAQECRRSCNPSDDICLKACVMDCSFIPPTAQQEAAALNRTKADIEKLQDSLNKPSK